MTTQFHVDQRGVVSALTSIDREQYDAFRFPVVAVDAGTPSRTSSGALDTGTPSRTSSGVLDTGTSSRTGSGGLDTGTPSRTGSDALDAGTPSRTGSALVVIDVDDVNDERPQFTQKTYVFRVSENELPGTNVIIHLKSLSVLL